MLTGGCFCGAIRYETDGVPFDLTNCRCSICRRISGAPFVAWFSVRRDTFRLVRGSPASFKSTPQALRSFCAQCATPLTFEHQDHRDEIDVTLCSLDKPDQFAPSDHTHVDTKLAWVSLDDGLPAYPEARTT